MTPRLNSRDDPLPVQNWSYTKLLTLAIIGLYLPNIAMGQFSFFLQSYKTSIVSEHTMIKRELNGKKERPQNYLQLAHTYFFEDLVQNV